MNLTVNNSLLKREHYYKYLGLYLDSSLNFNKHMDYVNRVTSHKIFLLSKVQDYIDHNTALYMFKSMICSIFDYGDIVYEGGTHKRLDKLKRTQNRGLKICLGLHVRFDTLQLHKLADVPQLYVTRQSNLKKYMFLQQNNEKYVIQRNIPTRTHGATVFETCIPKNEKYKKGSIYRGIQLWNSLSVNERNINTYEEYEKYQYIWRQEVTNLII